MMKWMVTAVIPLLLASALLAACSIDGNRLGTVASFESDERGSSSGATTSGSAASVVRSSAPAATSRAAVASAVSGDGARVAFERVATGREVIYTGDISLEVDDVPRATSQAQALIAEIGGLVYGQRTTGQPAPRTELTFKVLPDLFAEAMNRLASLGDLIKQETTVDDVTERVVDLESRIATALTSVERLRSFLASATDTEAVAELESRLLERETGLEQLRGELRTVRDQVALATIVLTLQEPPSDPRAARVDLVASAHAWDDDAERCPAGDELAVDEGESVTVCISVENRGDVTLVDLEIRDDGLRVDDDDFVAIEGSIEAPLEPDDVLLGYFRIEASPDRRPQPEFSAVAVGPDGDPLRIPVSVNYEIFRYEVAADNSLPGFTDGVHTSWDAVATLGQLGELALGLAVPFLWLVPLVAGVFWLARRLACTRSAGEPHRDSAAGPTGGADGEGLDAGSS